MPKVGPFVTDPRAGAYCRIKLDSGEKILVNHDKGGFNGGRLTIERVTLMGLSSERVFELDLDSPQGRATLGAITQGAQAGTVAATPLGAFVRCAEGCPSVAALVQKCHSMLPAT